MQIPLRRITSDHGYSLRMNTNSGPVQMRQRRERKVSREVLVVKISRTRIVCRPVFGNTINLGLGMECGRF